MANLVWKHATVKFLQNDDTKEGAFSGHTLISGSPVFVTRTGKDEFVLVVAEKYTPKFSVTLSLKRVREVVAIHKTEPSRAMKTKLSQFVEWEHRDVEVNEKK